MNMIIDYLTPNKYSRPQAAIKELLAIVIHWTANPRATAKNNRDYFEARKTGMGGYGSAHYILDQNGLVIATIPENEVAYHCGSSVKDPASGKFYTDYAREKFGRYAIDYKTNSPNYCTLGIELCPIDDAGNFTDDTIKAAIELCSDICKRTHLTAQDITTHNAIVGWKDCPRLWTKQPELLDAFRASVQDNILRGTK